MWEAERIGFGVKEMKLVYIGVVFRIRYNEILSIMDILRVPTGKKQVRAFLAWGKNGANGKPIYAIQCHSCIYATCCGQAHTQ